MLHAVICFANAINLANTLFDNAFRLKVNKKIYKENGESSESSEKVNVLGLYRFTTRRSRCAHCKLQSHVFSKSEFVGVFLK